MKAKAGQGVTINLGSYESIRFDVEIELGHMPTLEEKRRIKRLARSAMDLSSEIVGDAIEEIQKVIEFDKHSHFKIKLTRNKTKSQ
jgi:hypothetical protein